MDAEGWIAVAALAAWAAVPAGYLAVRYGRKQATSAELSRIADSRSSHATWSATRIAKEMFDREDRPEFESTLIHGDDGVIGVTLKAVTARLASCSTPVGA